MKHADVVVIGGSLAGAACVRELARQGIDAVAFERRAFPSEKVCGGFLSPGAVELLDELGVLDNVRAAGASTVRSSRVRMRKQTAHLELPRPGMGISRRVLDALMADHPAVQHGAVRAVQRDGKNFRVLLNDGEVTARVVVDAAGKLSRFTPRRTSPQFGVQFYETGSRGDALDFWFFDEGYGGIVTVEGGRSNGCFLVEKAALFDPLPPSAAFEQRPMFRLGARPPESGGQRDRVVCDHAGGGSKAASLQDLLRNLPSRDPFGSRCPPDSGGRAAPSRMGSVCNDSQETPTSRDWLVTGPVAYERGPSDFIAIGDAAGMVDPFCGEGMRHALDTGMRAARIIADGLSLGIPYDSMKDRYERDADRRWRGKRRLGKFIRAVLRYPHLFGAGFYLKPEYWFRKLWS